MFTPKTPRPNTGLEEAISRLHADMQTVDPNTEAYTKMAKNLGKLYKLRALDKEDKYRPSPDTLALVLANLLGIVIIVGYEQKNVIASKALSFVQKLG